ncbi:O-antigen ligase family protein [Scytonema sp. UIC 10036]|uniref:O-antigen ligase family protein n=1 Tax=Scytonema sp. UIC 10036 TaxID=2304196 RepID=UPI00140F58FA|nr:O-antigen ligase family protein [Scytonema sp. UIC 10036]
MSVKFKTRNKWLLYYQGCLAIGVIFAFFTRLDAYLTVNQLLISPVGWMLPYFALTIPLFILVKQRIPSNSLLYWCLGYFTVTAISYSFFPSSEASFQALIDRSFSSVFLLVTNFLFMNQQVLSWTRGAIAIATLVGILNNFYQFSIDPSAFGGLVEGRATGLYLNPNDCSNSLILGMIFTVRIFPPKFRVFWILLVGFGIVLTLSRGGILCWIITIITLSLTRVIYLKQFILWILGIGILLFFGFGDMTDSWNQLLDSNGLERLEGMIDGSTVEDASAVERQEVARKGWEMFLEHPIFGYGVGSTFDPSITRFTISTHNMYLLHLAEYGALGILILPLAIYSVIHRAQSDIRKIGIGFTVFILVSSFFCHTVLSLNSFLISFALMAVMSEMSQTRPNRVSSLREYTTVALSDSQLPE